MGRDEEAREKGRGSLPLWGNKRRPISVGRTQKLRGRGTRGGVIRTLRWVRCWRRETPKRRKSKESGRRGWYVSSQSSGRSRKNSKIDVRRAKNHKKKCKRPQGNCRTLHRGPSGEIGGGRVQGKGGEKFGGKSWNLRILRTHRNERASLNP